MTFTVFICNNEKCDYTDYDVIKIDYKDIKNINRSKIKDLVDNGCSLFVMGDNIDISRIMNILGLKSKIKPVTKNAKKIGVSIYRENNSYHYGYITLAAMQSKDSKVVLTDEIANEIANSDELIPMHIKNKKQRFKKAYELSSEKIKSNEVKIQLPSTNLFKYVYDDTYIPDLSKSEHPNAYSVSITQYVYDIARYWDDGDRKDMWDVISDIYVDAEDGYSVSYYEIDMRADSTNQQVLGATWLQSDTSQSISLGAGISVDSDGIITGSINTQTSYTYNASSQEITNDFPAGNVKSWEVNPVNNKTWSATWNFVPGIRFVNNNPDNLYNPNHSAYTKLIDLRGYRNELIDYYIILADEYKWEMGFVWTRY